MCRLDHFQNDRDVLMHDMLLYFPRVDQTNKHTVCQNRQEVMGTMPKFKRDFFRYEFQVSDDWEIYDVHGFFCKFHFSVELLMHDNHKENGKVHVKSITKFHKLEGGHTYYRITASSITKATRLTGPTSKFYCNKLLCGKQSIF